MVRYAKAVNENGTVVRRIGFVHNRQVAFEFVFID
jgi:hypothetical protein